MFPSVGVTMEQEQEAFSTGDTEGVFGLVSQYRYAITAFHTTQCEAKISSS